MPTISSAYWGVHHGFEITAVLVPDTESDMDYRRECDDDDQDYVAAYDRGDWNYVGVIVTASRAGVDLGSDSIWGSEYGMIPGVPRFVDPLTDEDYPYRADLIDNAVADARMKLSELAATL